jgi:hypothetical protein
VKHLHPLRGFLTVGWLVLVALAGIASAKDWPEGYVVYENTQSPDAHYGILVPTPAAWENDGSLAEKNYFADLKAHRLLGRISGADYFANQNHRGLKAVWPKDSSWCVVQYDDRFGFATIAIFEPKGSKFVQTDIGQRIQTALANALKSKGDRDAESGGDALPYYRFDGGKVLVRAASTTDPKEMDPKQARYGFFRGTYDVPAKKWLSSEGRRLTFEDYQRTDTALGDFDEDLAHTEYPSAESKLQSFDDKMNDVYGFLRTVLPPARFATVKKEQIEWLQKRDAAPAIEDKCKLLQARIKALQDLLW